MGERIFQSVCKSARLYELQLCHFATGGIDLHNTLVFPHNVFSIIANGAPGCSMCNLETGQRLCHDRPALALLIPPGVRVRRDITSEVHFFAVHFQVGFGAGPDFFTGKRDWWCWEDADLLAAFQEIVLHPHSVKMIARLHGILWNLVADRLEEQTLCRQVEAQEQFQTIFELVADAPERRFTVTELARKLKMRPDVFARNFHQTVGMTPRDFLLNARIRALSAALVSSDVTLAVLAKRFGYASEFQLSAFFKQRVGVSPSVFRRDFR